MKLAEQFVFILPYAKWNMNEDFFNKFKDTRKESN